MYKISIISIFPQFKGVIIVKTHIKDTLTLIGAHRSCVVIIKVDCGLDFNRCLCVGWHTIWSIMPDIWLGEHDLDAFIIMSVRPVFLGMYENADEEGAHWSSGTGSPGPQGIEELHAFALEGLQGVKGPAQSVLAASLREDVTAVVGKMAPLAVGQQLVTGPGHEVVDETEVDVTQLLCGLISQSLKGLKFAK